MRVSTTARSSLDPGLGLVAAAGVPSKPKGLVTTATVRMPSSLATAATTGAAPVPVPPPRPAVTKTMSAPASGLLDLLAVLTRRRCRPDLGIGAGARARR